MTQEEFKKLLTETNLTSKGIEDFINKMIDEAVPVSGKADTVAVEIFRAMGRIGYRYYNDGDYFYDGYGLETVAPSMAYLMDIIETYGTHEQNREVSHIEDDIMNHVLEDDAYWSKVIDIFKIILNIMAETKQDLFILENNTDSSDFDASWYEDNRPLYDLEFYVDKDIVTALNKGTIDKDDVLDYMESLVRDTFSYNTVEDIDMRMNFENQIIEISNLTLDQFHEIDDWNKSYNFWDEFKEQNAEELKKANQEEATGEDIEESLNTNTYLDRCKKVKEDYIKFCKDVKLEEDFNEASLDDDAIKRCCLKYNCGKQQIIEMIEDVK